MLVWTIFCESRYILFPNLVWWCSIMSQSRMDILLLLLPSKSRSQQGLIPSKYDSFYYTIRTVDSLATKLGLMKIIISQSVLWKEKKRGITAFRVKVTVKGQNVNVCPDDIFWTIKHFVFKLGIVIHHYESECHAKRFICYFQGQGHSKSSYDQNMTISTVSSELLIILLPNLVW